LICSSHAATIRASRLRAALAEAGEVRDDDDTREATAVGQLQLHAAVHGMSKRDSYSFPWFAVLLWIAMVIYRGLTPKSVISGALVLIVFVIGHGLFHKFKTWFVNS
jgi:hypothetical protein